MKAERQQKEATSRVLQQSKGGGECIRDNRVLFTSQKKLKEVMSESCAPRLSIGIENGIVQTKNAMSAGIVSGYTEDGEGSLFNIPSKIDLPMGNIYAKTLEEQDTKEEVLSAYSEETGIVGKQQEKEKYLDNIKEMIDIPNLQNFHQEKKKNDFISEFIKLDALTLNPTSLNYQQLSQYVNILKKANRHNARNINEIKWIDPFIVRITVPQKDKDSWIFETNFSANALGYITKVKNGAKNLTAFLIAKSAFDEVGVQDATPDNDNFKFSPQHDQEVDKSVGEQIETLASGKKNKENHVGFDAITKLAAEGARFEPVRKLGTDLKVDSKFFTKTDPSTDQGKCLTFLFLYRNWGGHFNHTYQTPAATLKTVATNHGDNFTINQSSVKENDYDLDQDKKANPEDY